MSWRPSLRQLLLLVNVSILAVPLTAVFLLPMMNGYLTRQTERSLLAQSALIAEAWRDRWLEARAMATDAGESVSEPSFVYRPPGFESDRYVPVTPTLDLTFDVLPPAPPPLPRPAGLPTDPAAVEAGRALTPALHRAQVFILSGVRVLDSHGCVVATSRYGMETCLDHLVEVKAALAGRYRTVVRERVSDEPPPSLSSMSRRGRLRVFVATPIFHDGEVIGVVWMSRTSTSPIELVWNHRGEVALLALLYVMVLPPAMYFLSHQISKPVRALTRRAEASAHGEPTPEFDPGPLAPREVITLRDGLEYLTDQLTDRARGIEEFARNASHELKTPITAISGAVELLREEGDDMTPEQRERFLANIAADADRMDRLVTRLLALARVQSEPEMAERVDVGLLLEEIRASVGEPIALTVDPRLPELAMVRDHLEAAVRNLLDNALRHGKGEGVAVRARRRDDRIEIAVSDRGPGIRPGDADRVFERFFTTARDAGGTGLGLSIVRAVADSRGGWVEFDTGPEGTEFRLVL